MAQRSIDYVRQALISLWGCVSVSFLSIFKESSKTQKHISVVQCKAAVTSVC